MFRPIAFILLLCLGGCAGNPIEGNYVSKLPDGIEAAPQYTDEPYHLEVRQIDGNAEDAFSKAESEGYVMIGSAAFESSKALNMAQVKEQAKKVNARLVIFGNRYAGRKEGMFAMKQTLQRTQATHNVLMGHKTDSFEFLVTFWHLRPPNGKGAN